MLDGGGPVINGEQLPNGLATCDLPHWGAVPSLVPMQRAFAFLALFGLCTAGVQAQAVTAADLAAVKSELAEDNKLLRTDFGSLEQRVEVLSRNVQQLAEQLRRAEAENRSLREAISKSTVGLVTRRELEQVVEQLKEVDKKRLDDGRNIRDTLDRLGEQLERLGKIAATPPPASSPSNADTRRPNRHVEKPTPKTEEPAAEGPTEFYEHEVQERETLAIIVAAYNKEHGLKVKTSDVLKANPSLKDPKKLYVGKKIRIPVIK